MYRAVFRKIRAAELILQILEGKPITPASSGGWTLSELEDWAAAFQVVAYRRSVEVPVIKGKPAPGQRPFAYQFGAVAQAINFKVLLSGCVLGDRKELSYDDFWEPVVEVGMYRNGVDELGSPVMAWEVLSGRKDREKEWPQDDAEGGAQ